MKLIYDFFLSSSHLLNIKIIRIFMKWHTGIAFQNTVSYHFVHPGGAFSMPQQPASHM